MGTLHGTALPMLMPTLTSWYAIMPSHTVLPTEARTIRVSCVSVPAAAADTGRSLENAAAGTPVVARSVPTRRGCEARAANATRDSVWAVRGWRRDGVGASVRAIGQGTSVRERRCERTCESVNIAGCSVGHLWVW